MSDSIPALRAGESHSGRGSFRGLVVRWLCVAVVPVLILSACTVSDPDDEASPTTGESPSAEPTGTQFVAPEVTETPAPTPESGGPVVERVVTGQGTSLLDFLGNALVVHRWQPWPDVFEEVDPFAEAGSHVFGRIGEGRAPGDMLVAVDLEVCASGEQPPDLELFSPRFHFVDGDDESSIDLAADPLAAVVVDRVVEPAFSWPAAGSCHRGWQTVAWSGDADDIASLNYVAVSRAEATFGERHVYQWTLDDPSNDLNEQTPLLPSNLKASFPSGELAGWAVTMLGWRPVGDSTDLTVPSVSFERSYLQPDDGYELIAALVEVCGGPGGHMPEFGLQIESWNLTPRFIDGEPWGPGYVTIRPPLPGDCTIGWLPFEMPVGAEPSGLFATDTDDPDSRVLSWSLDDEPLEAPATGAAWPTQFLIDTAAEECEALDPIEIEVADADATELTIASSVAVQEADNRIVVYLSQIELYAEDVPEPRDEAGSVLQLALNGSSGEGLGLGDYVDDSESDQRATTQILNPDGDIDLAGVTVTISEITPSFVCGFLSGGDSATVTGVFAAPLWEP